MVYMYEACNKLLRRHLLWFAAAINVLSAFR